MANLVELSNQLEYVPQEQLVQMSQDPNSMYPSFLVLSEIQRRNQMKKMYEAQQPKPETTVAEEVVQEFAGQQGLQGAMAQSPGPQNAFQPGDMGNMAPPSPMQAMASGGRTGYQAGGSLGLGGDSLAGTFTNPTDDVSNENTIPIESLSKEQRNEILEKSKGMSAADKLVLGLNAAALGLLVTPAPGARIASGVTKLLSYGVRGAQGLKKAYDTARSARLLKAGQAEYKRLGGVPRTTSYNPELIRQTGKDALRRDFIPKAVSTAILGGSAIPIISNLFDDNNEEIIEEQANINKPEEIDDTVISARKTVSEDVETGKKGLGQKFDADMLVALGGAIGSAKNLGELSSGISKAYFDVKSSRDAKDLAGLQGRLIEAQISKYEADVANMPLDVAIKQYQSLNDLVDSGVLTPEEAKIREAALMQRIQQLQSETGTGFAVSEAPTGGDILARNRVA
jgi:hypothetical protein